MYSLQIFYRIGRTFAPVATDWFSSYEIIAVYPPHWSAYGHTLSWHWKRLSCYLSSTWSPRHSNPQCLSLTALPTLERHHSWKVDTNFICRARQKKVLHYHTSASFNLPFLFVLQLASLHRSSPLACFLFFHHSLSYTFLRECRLL